MNKPVFVIITILLAVFATVATAAGKRLSYRGVSYDVFFVEPGHPGLGFYWKDRDGRRIDNFNRLKRLLHRDNKKLLFATNGGIYEVGYVPLGLYVEEGRELVSLNRKRGRGNFYLQPNGVFVQRKSGFEIVSTTKLRRTEGILNATQSGPLLVYRNRINPVFRQQSDSLKIRNGVGINRRGQAVFAISNRPVNFHAFSRFFKYKLKCSRALYLDGTISAMYLPATGRRERGGDFAGIIAVTE